MYLTKNRHPQQLVLVAFEHSLFLLKAVVRIE